jgi:hypothetical protein
MPLLLAPIMLLLWALHLGASSNYTLSDLKVLHQEKNYSEFFQHALDVRPSERLEEWRDMVVKMADGYGREILAKSDITKEQFGQVESLYTWASLRTDDVFRGQRQQIGLKYLQRCLKSPTPCWDEVKSFWEADQKDPETAFKLAELTHPFTPRPIPLWAFLDVALKSSLSEFYCQKEFVLESLWNKLEIDYIRLGPGGELLKKIDSTTHPDCLIAFNKWLLERVQRPLILNAAKRGERELAYQLLASQGKITTALSDFFYTVYLLESPSQGELFNYAWGRLKELSTSAARREEVLKKIKTLDPLPDEIFASLDLKKRRAILHHFKKNFPEYLSLYTDQCLIYYGGKTSFPKGNPTMKCPELMQAPEANTLLDPEKIQRFHQLRSL